ncbi:FAD-binding protein [Bacillus salacetis]|uniref:D-lactate dehydrogenase (cytochrome) n=1 Tax=Bacillus salacetis TaxID=2315464 RepID=A0A3A1QW65_9BACI|nr:FAD-linked oxidase C-terminal domain-containing protein [Bacillus salacetis]RIW31858.1 FAD-binding protein [Bacillus salacetis]
MNTSLINQLTESVGTDKVSISEGDLYRHSRDESSHPPVEPDVVVYPESKEEIIEILRIARENDLPVTPFGAGSGLDGHAIPINKGISINFERMNKILSFNPEDLTVTVQPGITRKQLNKSINRHGLQFPVDPGADASIGGMTATNASGTTAVRYGSMRDQVLNLEVILADGSVINTGSRAKKSSSGYNLNGLFVGSEGTLGIMTAITLKLHGIPEHTVTARCTFKTPKACAEAAQSILMSGIQVLRMELVDADSIRQVNLTGEHSFPEAHSLFLEFSGTVASAEEDANLTKELVLEHGGENWERADSAAESNELWRARHELAYSFRHIKGMANSGGDVCVPISQLADMVVYARKLIDESGLLGGVFGHVGDGNFHTLVVYDPGESKQASASARINDLVARKAIEVGGTCSGEHGVGLGKMKYQELEHGAALSVMKSIKQLLDPENRLNPGKIFS